MAGRYGGWAAAVVAASVCIGAVPATAAVASPATDYETVSWAVETRADETGVIDRGPASVPETPAAVEPVADGSSPTFTPMIMATGLVFLGGAILLVVRAGSTRRVDESL
ncbi:MAG: hypothetical protein ABWY54_05320 [Glaciihabitans sp.]